MQQFKGFWAERKRHELALLSADAVFSGERATRRQAHLNNATPRFQHAPHLVGVATVKGNVGMQIAFACVEHIG